MSPPSENSSGAEDDIVDEHNSAGNGFAVTSQDVGAEDVKHLAGGRIAELLQEERDEGTLTPQKLGDGTNRYKQVQNAENVSEDGSFGAPPRRINSPIDSILSVPDDSPSAQVGQKIQAIK